MFEGQRYYVVVNGDEAAARAAITELLEFEWIEPIDSVQKLFEGQQTALGFQTFYRQTTEGILNRLINERKVSWWTTDPGVQA